MEIKIKKLQWGNFDLDLIPSSLVEWKQDACPWNQTEGKNIHKCATKNTSICKYFCGMEYIDTVLCSYPHEAPDQI